MRPACARSPRIKVEVAEARSHLGRVLTAVGRSSVHQETPVRPLHRTTGPTLTIDAPGVRNAPQHLMSSHTTAQVRGTVKGCVVRRREVTRSTVSGKSLARPCVVISLSAVALD
jgi:hypothetical protein